MCIHTHISTTASMHKRLACQWWTSVLSFSPFRFDSFSLPSLYHLFVETYQIHTPQFQLYSYLCLVMAQDILWLSLLIVYYLVLTQFYSPGIPRQTTSFTQIRQPFSMVNHGKTRSIRSDPRIMYFRNHTRVETSSVIDYVQKSVMLFVVNFHFNQTGATTFLRETYFPEFALRYKYNFDVIFVGPADANHTDVLSNSLPQKGYYAYHSVAVAYNFFQAKKYKYAGYFFMNDDSCVDPDFLNEYDHKQSMRSNLNPWSPSRAWQWNYMKNEKGVSFPNALEMAMKQVEDVAGEICPYYKGEKWCGWSDFFFITRRDIPLFLVLEKAMHDNLSFLELAVPNMMACLNATKIVECNHGPMQFIQTCVHLHPVKYSKVENQELCMKRIRREAINVKPYSHY